jgi:aminotransferase
MPHVSEREQQLPEQEIGKLLRIAVEDKSVISLGPGEPDFPAPAPIVQLTKKYANQCNHYSPPGGRKELREAIARKLKRDNKIDVDPEQVVVTCGSQEALVLAAACTLDVSEQVILPDPSYMGFLPAFELFNAGIRPVPLREEDNFAIDPDEVEKAIDPKKTKVLMINSPANPTGTVLSRKLLEQLADIAIEHDLYIFSDEAYEKILYDGAEHTSIGSLNGMEERTVTFQSFSKTYAMCGYRVGYAVVPEILVEAMKRAHNDVSISAPTISQLVATDALKLPSKYTDAMVREYDRRRNLIVPRLNELGLRTPMPKGAFYAFSRIKHYGVGSRKFAHDLLTKAKVAVVPGTDFGKNGDGYVRFSFATDYKLIEKALDKLEKFLKAYKGKFSA